MKRGLLFEICAGLILSYWIISIFFSGTAKFEELALGTETITYQALDKEGKIIHLQHIDSVEKNEFVSGWVKRGKKDVVFILGNSQTHSINQKKDNEVNYVELLHNANPLSMREVLCVSQPNAGLQEFYLSYAYWKTIFPIRQVIIPVFMDDMREDGVRADVFFSSLVEEKFQLKDTTQQMVHKINADLRSFWSHNNVNAGSTVKNEMSLSSDETLQERTEKKINTWLDMHSVVWSNRQNVRGDFFNWTYRLRNTVLGINANTIRKMIPQRYDLNLEALNLMVNDCLASEISIVLYIPPIRFDVTLPYDLDEYQRFKSDIEAIAKKHPGKIVFKNYESSVPPELWGYKDATNLKDEREIDFMHFQFRGHRILADSLQRSMNLLNSVK